MIFKNEEEYLHHQVIEYCRIRNIPIIRGLIKDKDRLEIQAFIIKEKKKLKINKKNIEKIRQITQEEALKCLD